MDFEPPTAVAEAERELLSLSQGLSEQYWLQKSEEDTFPEEFWRELSKGRWFDLLVPRDQGGRGLGLLGLCYGIRALARGGAGLGAYALLSNAIVARLLADYGSAEQRKLYLRGLSEGQLRVTLALTERESGSDALAISTFAMREGSAFRVQGTKMFVNNSDQVDLLLLVCRTEPLDPQHRSRGITVLITDARQSQLAHRRLRKLGMRYFSTTELEVRGISVPTTAVLGPQGDAWPMLASAFNADRVATAAMLIGTGELVLSRAVAYARERNVFGRPIGSNQAIQLPLADSSSELTASWWLTARAAWLHDTQQDYFVAANQAKLRAAYSVFKAADRSLQVFGGLGYLRDTHVERHWRDVRAWLIAPLSQELTLALLAQHDLGLPKSY